MLLQYISLVLLFTCIPRGESQYTCESPYICKSLKDCREQSDGKMRNKVIFPCGRDKYCCLTQVKIKPTVQELGGTITTSSTERATTERPVQEEVKPQLYSDHPNYNLFPTACGRIHLSDRIVDGNNTELTEFPWMVLLGYQVTKGKIIYACGGTLISDRYILTAAHCLRVENIPVSVVRLGEWDTNTDPDSYGGATNIPAINIKLTKRTPHEDYNTLSHRNDIALLRLSSKAPIPNASRIAPICLPWNISHLNIGEHYSYEASGWGISGNGEENLHNILQKVKLEGVNLKDCNARACTSSIPSCPIDESQVCAQGKVRKDVCKGDSGGPLMTNSVKIYQIGITSIKTTQECGAADIPSIFTRVEKYLSWILDNVEP